MALTQQEIQEALQVSFFDHDYKSWERNVKFIWQGEEQKVKFSWSEWDGYDIVKQELTEKFEEWLKENDLDLAIVLDDLTWKMVE